MKLSIVLYTEGLPFTGDTIDKQALGGAETALTNVARELARLGHEVTVFCPCPAPGKFNGVIYRDHHEFHGWSQDGQCDLFICSRFFEVFALNIPASGKILWSHDCYTAEDFQRLERYLPVISAIYCVSGFHHDYFVRHLPDWTHKIRQTHNGLDLSLVDEAMHGAIKSHRIMYTSRPERGLMRALNIYEKLADTTLELVICTYDYPWEQGGIGAIKQACQAKIEELRARGFPIRISFFSKSDLYRELATSKAVIYPAEIPEITPISALEAQACRAVYLAPDHSGFQEVVSYQRMDLHDTNRWVDFLREVLADDALREQLAEKGWQHVQPFTWSEVAREFAERGIFVDMQIVQTRSGTRVNTINPGGAIPKISCVMPTLDRTILAKEAIQCFLNQTYQNKELVIVAGGSERNQRALSSYVTALGLPNIICIPMQEEHAPLGRMRNISLDAATGDIICQWDDDDLYHPERLSIQADAMHACGASACFLTDYLHYFEQNRELYWVDLRREGRAHGKGAQMPGTLMMVNDNRFRYPEGGQEAMIGEDCVMQDLITAQLKVVNLTDHGYLYVYRYHGRNTCSEGHHRGLANAVSSGEYILRQMPNLAEALQYFKLPMPISIRSHSNQEVMSFNN